MNIQEKKLKAAAEHLKAALQSLSNVQKRGKKKNPCACSPNPRVHFPKTKRGRRAVKRSWTLQTSKRPPVRFKATKSEAYERARKYARTHKKVVLDGPK